MGYRQFDTAFFYENEDEVGQAIKEKIAEGVIKREDVFVVTKVRNDEIQFSHSKSEIISL